MPERRICSFSGEEIEPGTGIMFVSEGLINRDVDEGPPVRVAYALSEHGIACGRLLSPLVAHLKIRSGSVQ